VFIVQLKFTENKRQAGQYMDAHNNWIKQGFDDGVFSLVGKLQPNLGGGIIAHNTTLVDLKKRINDDPFIVENIVFAEILEIDPIKMDERLSFLSQ